MEHNSSSKEGSKTQAESSQKYQAAIDSIRKEMDDHEPQGTISWSNDSKSSKDRCYSRIRDSLSTDYEPGLLIIPTPKGMEFIGRFKTVQGSLVLCTAEWEADIYLQEIEEKENTRQF